MCCCFQRRLLKRPTFEYRAECSSDATLLLERFVVLKKLTFGVSWYAGMKQSVFPQSVYNYILNFLLFFQARVGTDSSFSAGPPGVPAPVVPASRRVAPPLPPLPPHPQTLPTSRQPSSAKRPPPANASLHSSNDSGFSNDPPPAPEADYSDDEAAR